MNESNVPNGVTKKTDNSNEKRSMNYVDPKILNEINITTKKFEKIIKRTYGSLEGFDEVIKKATKTDIDRIKKIKDTTAKFDKELKAIENEFGKDSEQYKEHSQVVKKQLNDLKKESKELALKTNRDFMIQSFKNETKQHEIKFMDNEFVKNNNLASVNNDYYSQLEKLKTSGFDTYGEGFENNKDYKKALMNLNESYIKDMKDAWKEDFKENHKVLGEVAEGVKDTFDRNKESLQGLLGPLNLFIAPLQEFFGGFGKVFKFLGGGIRKLFGKGIKKNPNATDVMKSGAFGVGALYIGNILKNQMGDDKGDKKEKIFDKLKEMLGFKGGAGGAMSGLLGKVKGLLTNPVTYIVAGVIWMAVDAIRGIFKADEWGVSKVSAGIGGALGGMDKGIKGAFKNMGKWALIGAGVGTLICPIVGTIAGGLIGGAIGGILGYIGGEKIANFFEPIVQWFKDTVVTSFKELFDDMLGISKIKAIFSSDEPMGKKLGKFVIQHFKTIIMLPFKFLSFGPRLWAKVFKKTTQGKDFKKSISDFGSKIWEGLKDFGSGLWEGVKDIFNGVKESPVGQFVSNLFSGISEGVNKFFSKFSIGNWIESYIIEPIKNALGMIGDFFGFIADNWDWKHPIVSMTTIFGGFKADEKTGLSQFDVWRSEKNADVRTDISVDDAIIRTDGSVIKTNPQDTLVALKNIPLSLDKVRKDNTENLNSSLINSNNNEINDKLNSIIDVLSKLLDKDVQVNLPPQTRGDLDLVMSGALV
jgi:hypothetical protein